MYLYTQFLHSRIISQPLFLALKIPRQYLHQVYGPMQDKFSMRSTTRNAENKYEGKRKCLKIKEKANILKCGSVFMLCKK